LFLRRGDIRITYTVRASYHDDSIAILYLSIYSVVDIWSWWFFWGWGRKGEGLDDIGVLRCGGLALTEERGVLCCCVVFSRKEEVLSWKILPKETL
jgi:hypothetical protein